MITECVKSVELELEHQVDLEKRLSKRFGQISGVGNHHLLASFQKGVLRYFLLETIDGVRTRVYMNKSQQELRRQIQERYYLERAIPMCQKNIEMLEMLRDSYYSLEPEDIVKDAPLAYHEQENACRLLYGVENETRWKERKLKQKEKFKIPFPEGLTDIAEDGTQTRSKSESLIINQLNSKGIPYVYEFPMRLGGKIMWPDFVLWDRKHNREVLIEHMGLMSQSDYIERQVDKLQIYIQNGYVPNVNLLLTFDDKDGNINVPAISKMIDAIMCR